MSADPSADPIPYPKSTPSGEGLAADLARGSVPPSNVGDDDRPTDLAEPQGMRRADELIDRIAQSAHETIDRLAQSAHSAAQSAAPQLDKLQQGLSGSGGSMQSRADQMRDIGDEWVEGLSATVRDHPIAAVGVALAIGMLIARS